jgi:hypothetical protein
MRLANSGNFVPTKRMKLRISKKIKTQVMNHLLNPINWSTYIETSIVLLAIYYGWIGWKYYRPEIDQMTNRISGKTDESNELPAALQYQGEEQAESPIIKTTASNAYPGDPHDAQHEERNELKDDIKDLIHAAQDKPYNPAALISGIKRLLNEHEHLAHFPDREAINELIVQECEKTGTALLTEGEVDLWWEA